MKEIPLAVIDFPKEYLALALNVYPKTLRLLVDDPPPCNFCTRRNCVHQTVRVGILPPRDDKNPAEVYYCRILDDLDEDLGHVAIVPKNDDMVPTWQHPTLKEGRSVTSNWNLDTVETELEKIENEMFRCSELDHDKEFVPVASKSVQKPNEKLDKNRVKNKGQRNWPRGRSNQSEANHTKAQAPPPRYERKGEDPRYVYEQGVRLPPPNGNLRTREVKQNGAPRHAKRVTWCTYCRSNRETYQFQRSHRVSEMGITTCPVLRIFNCPICHATGDMAHTKKYCPFKPTAAAHRYRTTLTPVGRRKLVRY